MELDFYQVDAFADTVFEGNPAAVYPLSDWLPDAELQAIAAEHNLSETAFFVPERNGYHIRWFTPKAEVALCGHATLACAHVVFSELDPAAGSIQFSSLSGPLSVQCESDRLTLNFPAVYAKPCDTPAGLSEGLGIEPAEALRCEDYVVVLASEEELVRMAPDLRKLSELECRGICVTAPGETADFVSRFFAPRHGIDEDPVTGSAHCFLTPYWSNRLGKSELTARQLSRRGGALQCRVEENRVFISGTAVTYSKGKAWPGRSG